MRLKVTVGALLVSAVLIGSTACGSQQASQSTAEVAQEGVDHGAMDHGAMDHSGHSMSMDLGPKDETFDLRFIDAMTLHHQGAVDMANAAVENSNRMEIQNLAEDIISAQDQEISQMQQWRQAWYPDVAAEPVMYDSSKGEMAPMSAEMESAMKMNVDLGAPDDEFDLRFIQAMIPHHEGALDMAQEALEKSDRTEIRQLAEAILTSQQQEIDQMQQWQKEWYGN
ncbi:MAG TPA: DUF305 domain-containing protein [Trichocoleus sp.]